MLNRPDSSLREPANFLIIVAEGIAFPLSKRERYPFVTFSFELKLESVIPSNCRLSLITLPRPREFTDFI